VSVDGVVLVHGSNLTALCWDPMIQLLAPPAIAVDLPGRGARPTDIRHVTLADCVGAVVDSADQAGMDRFVLVGHSLGGVVISEVARRFGDRVAARAYVAALVPAPGTNAAGIMFGADLSVDEPRTTTEDRARLYFGNDMNDAQWTELWAQFVPESPLLWNARSGGHRHEGPTVYVSMTGDVGMPPDLTDRMIANLGPGVERRVIDAGHIAMVTKPRELAEVINDLVNC
jgi:pimeloyl-ACP methyl ester carboxylesterase